MYKYDCIIKTALDTDGNVQWQGLYLNGKKVVENFQIDLDIALPIFAPEAKNIHEVNVLEDDFSSIASSFPDEEDFSYLLDYRTLEVGDIVWLENGSCEVCEVFAGYRPAGDYPFTDWCGDVPLVIQASYMGHTVTNFKIKGSDMVYVWEDYNYQQSNLYDLSKTNKKVVL
jgi:hypothetical protein